VRVRTLDASFPHPTPEALAEADAVLAAVPASETVVIDGLAYGALPAVIPPHQGRLRLVALVHHPLWLETGLDAARSEGLRRGETRALASARRIVVTSPATGQLLRDQGIPAHRIRVVVPGVDPAPAATGSTSPGVRLLCVATVTPRKGHDLLLEALAGLAHLPWSLRCVGSLDRDREWCAKILGRRSELGLEGRVKFTGALGDAELEREYRQSDAFVLATRFEGYGMVVAEALARGLPIVATRTGALPELVPPRAGVLVPPGEPRALAHTLAVLIGDGALRQRLAAGSRRAGLRLPTWDQAARTFAAACLPREPVLIHG
jgi:glycosyltransferase involved in cell wall biosynthesis